MTSSHSTLDPEEIEKFSKLADQWWDPNGSFKVLHRFNPVRLGWLKTQITSLFNRDPFHLAPLTGVRLLDIGCGGGLLSEPFARLGAEVLGIDASEKNVKTASLHAEGQHLPLIYRHQTAEDLLQTGETFDIILAMEIVEHIPDPKAFLTVCTQLLSPGGGLFVGTLNRTFKSFLLGIVAAEYLLGWLPKGTHQWERFLPPETIKEWLAADGLHLLDQTGIICSPLTFAWSLSKDQDVNYILSFQKPVPTGEEGSSSR